MLYQIIGIATRDQKKNKLHLLYLKFEMGFPEKYYWQTNRLLNFSQIIQNSSSINEASNKNMRGR
jgi:hypothetical protein